MALSHGEDDNDAEFTGFDGFSTVFSSILVFAITGYVTIVTMTIVMVGMVT